jgi:D-alanyl-D-alanine carboxypeptidase
MSSTNDIPVAQRVSSDVEKSAPNSNSLARSLKSVPWWAYTLAILAFFSPLVGARYMANVAANSDNQEAVSSNAEEVKTDPNKVATTTGEDISTPGSRDRISSFTDDPAAASDPDLQADYVELPDAQNNSSIKHFAYAEAPETELQAVARASDGYEIRLRSAAAESFVRMVDDARADGVYLVAISGFRTQDEQNQLFFNIGQQRNQNPSERATVSAPPGYSEHHTGYAVDIGDGDVPSTNISQKFEQTAAFQWLQQNGARYGFEMSFPINNKQGVAYEPWHWRFVGDKDSLETFYKTKNSINTAAETAGAG